MGDCVSKDDCTHLCDDEYGARFQQPAPFDPKTGFTFATPAEGTKLAWGIQPYYTYYRPTIDARQTQRSRSLTPGPPRVPAVPLAGQLPSDTADSRASGSSSSTNGGGCSSEPFGSDSTPPRDARLHDQLDNNHTVGGGGSSHNSGTNGAGGLSGSSAVLMSSGGEALTASTSPPATQKGVEGDNGTANNTAYARSVRVIGSSNYVHLMAFTAQSVVPAVDGPVLRLTVRNECHASMAIGVVPLAHAAELYGPNRYLYDWRSHDVCGGGVTLWARDQATPFGIFDFGSPKERNQADLHGMCVKGSFVTLELDVATRVVRLSVRPGEVSGKDGTDGDAKTGIGSRGAVDRTARRAREIVGTIRPNTIGLDTPLVFVVAPMSSGDVVTIVPPEC